MKKPFVFFFASLFLLLPNFPASGAQVVDSLINTMSVRRKIAQLMVVTADNRYGQARMNEENHCVRDEQIGGIIVMGKELNAAMQRLNYLQSLSEMPLLCFTDAEWGAAMRLTGFRPFPRQGPLARHGNDTLVYQMGRAVAEELKQVKIQVNFAPVVDINVNPDNIVIGERSFGSDRRIVADLGSAYAAGMQDGGVIACAKHFPGHGDTSVDSHKGLPVLDFDRARLDSLELYPFRELCRNGVGMIMVGHLVVPALDPSGLPASLSRPIVTDLLRHQMGFEGLIVCDALNMRGVLSYFGGSGAKTCLAAYEAGADILLMPTDVTASLDLIEAKILSGQLSLEDLNTRVRRVLNAKLHAGLLAKDYDRYVNPELVNTEISSETLDRILKICNSGSERP